MADHPFVTTSVHAALECRYVIGPEIAVGGQGVVYRATRLFLPDGTPTHDDVALKLHLYRRNDARVQHEIAAMERISHPNLARLVEHGYCDVGGRYTRYVAWEFIEGQTLSDRLKGGRLLESEVVEIGRAMSSAIAEIWSQRIVHGDINPANIMLRESGGAVLIDLGAARHLEQDNSPAARTPIGTVGYFSPEQARGIAGLTCASDVFSLGVVMLQALLGRHPTDYHQSSLTGGVRASEFRVGATPGLLSMLDKMLSMDPKFRPTPASLHSFFQRMLQKRDEQFSAGSRSFLQQADRVSKQ